MGLFNDLTIDPGFSLPGLTATIHQWQTKDVVDKLGMYDDLSLDANGKLYTNLHQTEWIEDSSKPLGGYFETLSTKQDPFPYTGAFTFYNSYCHPEYEEGSAHDFISGWFEYGMTFVRGQSIGEVELIEHENPVKFSPEETALRRHKALISLRAVEKIRREQRITNPSTTEKLIDTIDALAYLPEDMVPQLKDCTIALQKIAETITRYRHEYDRWFIAPTHDGNNSKTQNSFESRD